MVLVVFMFRFFYAFLFLALSFVFVFFHVYFFFFCFFFFQAEDGIRDTSVTGVQTCALPILAIGWSEGDPAVPGAAPAGLAGAAQPMPNFGAICSLTKARPAASLGTSMMMRIGDRKSVV